MPTLLRNSGINTRKPDARPEMGGKWEEDKGRNDLESES